MNMIDMTRADFVKLAAIVQTKEMNDTDEWIDTFYMVNPACIYYYFPYGYKRGGEDKVGTLIAVPGYNILSPLPIENITKRLLENNKIFTLKDDDLNLEK